MSLCAVIGSAAQMCIDYLTFPGRLSKQDLLAFFGNRSSVLR
jgi:hypothetical protein